MDFSVINIQAIIAITFTLFAVIDVLGSVPILLSVQKKMGPINVRNATLASGLFMILFLFFGKSFLGLMGVDINSFAVAGSIVIFILGLEMVLGVDFFRSEPDTKAGSIIPVAFPIIAGSGTLTTIMSLKANYHSYNILISIIINLIAIYLVLSSITYIERKLGKSGLLIIRKFFGVILLAIAVKIFKTNLFI
jgi:multiple antibiotic resistance protein